MAHEKSHFRRKVVDSPSEGRHIHHLYIYIDRWWYRWWGETRNDIRRVTTSTTNTTCYALLTWVCPRVVHRKDFENGSGGGGGGGDGTMTD